MWKRTPRLIPSALLVVAVLGTLSFGAPPQATGQLPAKLSDQEFWRLTVELSEPAGTFRSENLVSNEHTFQYVIPALKQVVRPGGVYLGVAPDQNFTYIIAVEPKMAFIVDIRRGNLLQHLLYKAIIELSADRADFIARLFSKRRPAGVGPTSTVEEIFAAFSRVSMTEQQYLDLYSRNLADIRDVLLRRHRFALSPADLDGIERIYFAFFWEGPSIRYSTNTSSGGFSGRGMGGNFPTYEDLMLQADWDGQHRSYLATEEHFRRLKALEDKNLLVPVVGNFAGPKALRAVGRYIREHGGTVSAFYVSNVEQYLFQDVIWDEFARNVATLPIDDTSVFIRSVSSRNGYIGTHQWGDGRASALDPIKPFVRDFLAGRIRSYYDVNVRSR